MPKALGCEGGRQDSEQGRAVCPSLVTKGFSEKKTPPPPPLKASSNLWVPDSRPRSGCPQSQVPKGLAVELYKVPTRP